MVYTGKPSKSCEACRLRKRRCDKAVPSCGQCQRQGAACPGYRDALSLAFRDQTSHVIRRAKSRPQHTRSPVDSYPARQPEASDASDASSETSSGSSGVLVTTPTTWASPPSPPSSLSPIQVYPSLDAEELGTCFFLRNYMLHSFEANFGALQLTSDILVAEKNPFLMRAAMTAVTLASLANMSTDGNERRRLMFMAQSKCSAAVQALNIAISDPVMSLDDDVVYAILMLSIYETIGSPDKVSLSAWKQHIYGCLALLVHRGAAQFDHKQGLDVFRECSTHIITACYRLGLPFPDELRNLHVDMHERLSYKEPSFKIISAHATCLDLLKRANSYAWPMSQAKWEALLADSLELDFYHQGQFEMFVKLGGPMREFTTVNDPYANPEIVYKGTYHRYADLCVAKVWNGMRIGRIALNRLIRALADMGLKNGRSFEALSLDGSKILRMATETLATESRGILYSVPQMMGYVTGGLVLKEPDPFHPRVGCHFLLFPLDAVGATPGTDEYTQRWVVNRLRAMQGIAGIRQAGICADVLEAKGTDNW